jgi:hypothetical protein
MLCKAANSFGMITTHHHALGIRHALPALVVRAAITGVSWWTGFGTPDLQAGMVQVAVSATVRRGLEIVADGIDAAKQPVWLWTAGAPSTTSVDASERISHLGPAASRKR